MCGRLIENLSVIRQICSSTVEAGTKLGGALRQGFSDVHSKFKENDKLVAACEQAGSKLNEIMQSDDAQAIKGQLSKLLSSINQSEK